MKTITINTAAVWGSGVSAWQDGDIFRETNTDIWTTAIADRLGYLKTAVDGAVLVTGNQSVAGNKTLSGTTTLSGPVVMSGVSVNITSGLVQSTSTFTSFTGEVVLQGLLSLDSAPFAVATESMSDADGTFDTDKMVHIIPALTANRIFTLPSAAIGTLAIIKKTAATGAFTATIRDSVGAPNTLGIISASSQGWILAQCVSTVTWRTLMWGGTVTSILT